jgi:WD40 repeat protein
MGGADGRVYRWRFDRAVEELPPSQWSRRFERYIGHATSVGAVRYHPLGSIFFSGDWDGSLSAWRDYEAAGESGLYEKDPVGGGFYTRKPDRIVVQRPGGGEGIELLAVDRAGKRIFVGRQDGSFDVWAARGMKHLGTQPAAGGALSDLQVAPDGESLATSSRDGRVRLYRLKVDKAELSIVPVGERLFAGGGRLAFIPDGTLLVGDKSGKVSVVSFQ